MKGVLSTGANIGASLSGSKSAGADVGAETRYIPGPQGDVGPRGPQGEKGDAFKYSDFTPEQLAALTGPTGPKGDKGDKGDRGEAFKYSDFTEAQLEALRGPQGKTGPQGERGYKGDKGDKGDTGATGAGFKVLDYYPTFSALIDAVPSPNVGDAYGVGASEPYDIYIYGATSGWKNNGPLQGAKGDTGAQGEQGIQGIQGPPGEKGADGSQGPKGDTGPEGPQGPAGADGKSAYQSAKDGGYIGSEEQFNSDLSQVSGKEASGTAASAVSAHNSSSTAHSDIRAAVSDAANAASAAQSAANTANANATNTDLVKYINGALKTIGGTAVAGGVQIEIGSYVGTGKHGQSNPCSLSFAFEPKLIVYLGERASDDPIDSVFHDPYWLRALPSKLTTSYKEQRGFVYTYDFSSYVYGKISPDGKTVSWYSPEGAYEQYNFSGTTYYFFAIG